MRTLLILFMPFFLVTKCNAQSDLLILKKNNKTVQSFYTGTQMHFYTGDHYHEGSVTAVEKDSVYLVYYDVRQVMTRLGVYMLDTVASYPFAVDFRAITAFKKERTNFDWGTSGAVLMGGGLLLTVAGLLTWVFTKPDSEYYASTKLVVGAAIIAVAGYFIAKLANKDIKLGKKYSLHYIKLK